MTRIIFVSLVVIFNEKEFFNSNVGEEKKITVKLKNSEIMESKEEDTESPSQGEENIEIPKRIIETEKEEKKTEDENSTQEYLKRQPKRPLWFN